MQLASPRTFLRKLQNAEVLVVFFYTNWCRRCPKTEENLRILEEKYFATVANFIKVDMDSMQGWLEEHTDLDILRVPHVMLFYKHTILWEGTGSHCDDLEEHLQGTISGLKQIENLQ